MKFSKEDRKIMGQVILDLFKESPLWLKMVIVAVGGASLTLFAWVMSHMGL